MIDLKLSPALPIGVRNICHMTNGHMTNGHMTNGHMTNGHMTSVLWGGVCIYPDEAVFAAGGISYVIY